MQAYLTDPTTEGWETFRAAYRELLDQRFREDPRPFDELAELARDKDVLLGCSCPTRKNPDVRHCHTVLALEFMKQRYRNLVVVFPQ